MLKKDDTRNMNMNSESARIQFGAVFFNSRADTTPEFQYRYNTFLNLTLRVSTFYFSFHQNISSPMLNFVETNASILELCRN